MLIHDSKVSITSLEEYIGPNILSFYSFVKKVQVLYKSDFGQSVLIFFTIITIWVYTIVTSSVIVGDSDLSIRRLLSLSHLL